MAGHGVRKIHASRIDQEPMTSQREADAIRLDNLRSFEGVEVTYHISDRVGTSADGDLSSGLPGRGTVRPAPNFAPAGDVTRKRDKLKMRSRSSVAMELES